MFTFVTPASFADSARTNGVLAPSRTDIDPSVGGNYFACIPSGGDFSYFVFEWEQAPNFEGGELNTFQL